MLATIHRDPWNLVNQWRRDIDRVFGGLDDRVSPAGEVTAAAWAPAVDIKEEDGAYVLHADVPGVDPKDIELDMENGVLTLRGERKAETTEDKDNYRRVERVTGRFYRRFLLPDTADAENISAKSLNGVLEVRIPKQAKVLPRRITVSN
ncbi:MAG: Hsp20/alpha crystallin family protein [Gammaproteobacteria bacterium]|nr:Hsp20/alpha crystallin family protein [Gammaproteobacteria bacterium]MBA3731321.1 Hsp20/alpha crystallin family protein [Gammaproteobacteria bacterium]